MHKRDKCKTTTRLAAYLALYGQKDLLGGANLFALPLGKRVRRHHYSNVRLDFLTSLSLFPNTNFLHYVLIGPWLQDGRRQSLAVEGTG